MWGCAKNFGAIPLGGIPRRLCGLVGGCRWRPTAAALVRTRGRFRRALLSAFESAGFTVSVTPDGTADADDTCTATRPPPPPPPLLPVQP